MATLILYVAIPLHAVALPTSSNYIGGLSSIQSVANYATTSDTPGFATNLNYRSTFEIVWTCLTVIIASSWLCVHPNITGHSTVIWQRLRERLLLFGLALFAPEVMAVFAYYQWIGSQKLYLKFQGRAEELNKTLPLDSGASTLEGTPNDTNGQPDYPPDQTYPTEIVTNSTREEHLLGSTVHGGTYRWGTMKRFWEGIALLFFEKLVRPITSYMTDPKKDRWSYTHAHFVQMGGVAFRDKSGNVGFKKPDDWTNGDFEAFFSMSVSEGAISDRSKAGALAKTLVIMRVLWFLIQMIARKAQGLPIALLEVASLAFIVFNIAMYGFWWNKPLDVEYPLEISNTFNDQGEPNHAKASFGVAALLVGIFDMIPVGLWLYSPQKQWYPRLYSFGHRLMDLHNEFLRDPPSSSRDGDGSSLESERYVFLCLIEPTFLIAVVLSASTFGAFHTIGWYAPSPSDLERTLWRASSLVLIIYPFVATAHVGIYYFFIHRVRPWPWFKHVFHFIRDKVLVYLGILPPIAYVVARLIIIFLPFFELRNLPPLVHETVSWSRFISPI